MTTVRPQEPQPSAEPRLADPEAVDPGQGLIVVRVHDVSQLFNSLDPSPFLERDLDDDLVDYITSWAREIPAHRPLRVVIQLREPPRRADGAAQLRAAVHNHFTNSAQLVRNEFRQLLRRGRLSLLIGLAVLGTATAASELVLMAGDGPLLTVVREGLIIGGWVAMWRPIEILLYDWWPVRAERKLHERLRDAPVEVRVVPGAAASDAPPTPAAG